MKKFLSILLCVLLGFGLIGGTFAFAKHFYEKKDEDKTTQVWQLVTDDTVLQDGDKIIIAARYSDKAMSTTQKTSNRSAANITKEDDMVTFGEDVAVITLIENPNSSFVLEVEGGYLFTTDEQSNLLKTTTDKTKASEWRIEVDENNDAIISTGTHDILYNATYDLFNAYVSSEGNNQVKAIQIYKFTEVEEDVESTEEESTEAESEEESA